MLEPYFVHDCTIYKGTQDEYGDMRLINPVQSTCWFRDITTSSHHGNPNRDVTGSASMIWFRPTEDVAIGDIVTTLGNTYIIKKIYEARRLGQTQVQFIKTEVDWQSAGVS